MDPVILTILRYALALLWLVSAFHKFSALPEFRVTLEDYRLLPVGVITAILAVFLPATELLVGLGLLVPVYSPVAASVSAVLLLVYGGAMGINLARGRRHIDCGCTGPAQRQALSGALIIRNLVLVALSLVSIAGVASREMLWLDFLTVAAAVITLALIYATFNSLVANQPSLAQLRR